jgi:hypothetical protein
MPFSPVVTSGTIYNHCGNNISNSRITFTYNSKSQSVVSDSQGHYAIDLADIEVTTGVTVSYIAKDQFENELYSGSFIATSPKTLNINLSLISSTNVVKGNRDTQIYTIGGKPVSNLNPLPVEVSKYPFSEPSSTTIGWDANGNPTTITKVFGIDTYTQTITWNADGNPTNISRWVKS